MKERRTVEQAFKALDDQRVGFLTLKELQRTLPTRFNIVLSKEKQVELFKGINKSRDGIIKFQELAEFFALDFEAEIRAQEQRKGKFNMHFEIFDHIVKIIHQKQLTLREVFDQIDLNKNGVIELEEFKSMLERLGFAVTEEDLLSIFREMDENFDGSISYKELARYILSLGIKMNSNVYDEERETMMRWRDKAIESVVHSLNKVSKNSALYPKVKSSKPFNH